MNQSIDHEFGSTKALLLAGVAVLLLLVAGALYFVMGNGPSDKDKAREAAELREMEGEDGKGGRRIPGEEWKGKEVAGGATGIRKLSSLQSELDDQLKKGSKTEEEMEKKYTGPPMDVAVQGPKDADPRAPELYEKMKKEYLSKIADCYKQSLSGKPSLRGRLNLSLTIHATKSEDVGQVNATVAKSSTIQDQKLSACVARRVSRMTVPGIYAVEQKDTVFEYALQLDPGEATAAAPLEPLPPDNNPDPDTPEGRSELKALQAIAAAEASKRVEMPAPGENVAPPTRPGAPGQTGAEGQPGAGDKAPAAGGNSDTLPEGHDDPDSPNYRPPPEPRDPPPVEDEPHEEPPPE